MTVKAFTTENINPETLATAIVVMDALQTNSDDFLAGFETHGTATNVKKIADNRYSFVPVMDGLEKEMSISIQKGKTAPISLKILAGENIVSQITKTFPEKPSPKKNKNSQKPKH